MISTTAFGNTEWGNTSTASSLTSYIGSKIHNTLFSNVSALLKNVLGNHLINRRMLLGSSQDGQYNHTSAYTWTNGYLTLPSYGQFNGTFASHTNKYDDGEANYKLPLYNYRTTMSDNQITCRNISGWNRDRQINEGFYHKTSGYSSGPSLQPGYYVSGICPIILVR